MAAPPLALSLGGAAAGRAPPEFAFTVTPTERQAELAYSDSDTEVEEEEEVEDSAAAAERTGVLDENDAILSFARNLVRHPALRSPDGPLLHPAVPGSRPQVVAVNEALSQLIVLRQPTSLSTQCRLLVTDLQRLKTHGSSPHEEIECSPPLPHDADRLVLNQTGDVLAVLSPSSCRLLFLSRRHRGRPCRCHEVGAFFHTTRPGLAVLQAAFHPLSARHLLLLTSDRHLRMYNVSLDLGRPEGEYPLPFGDFGRFAFGGAGGAGVLQRRVAALVHDVGETPPAEPGGAPPGAWWSRMTVFLLRSGGAVHALCPVVPAGCLLTAACRSRLRHSLQYPHYAAPQGASDWLAQTWVEPVSAAEQEALEGALGRAAGDAGPAPAPAHGTIYAATPLDVAPALQGPLAVARGGGGRDSGSADDLDASRWPLGDLAVVLAGPFYALCVTAGPSAPLDVFLGLEAVVPLFAPAAAAPSLLPVDSLAAADLALHAADEGGTRPASPSAWPARLAAAGDILYWHCPGAGAAEVSLPWARRLAEAFAAGDPAEALSALARRGGRSGARLSALAPPGPLAAAAVVSLPLVGRYTLAADAELRCVVAEAEDGADAFDGVLPDLFEAGDDERMAGDNGDDEPFGWFVSKYELAMPSQMIRSMRGPVRLDDPAALKDFTERVSAPAREVEEDVTRVRLEIAERLRVMRARQEDQRADFRRAEDELLACMRRNEQARARVRLARTVQPALLDYVRLALAHEARRHAGVLSPAERLFQDGLRARRRQLASLRVQVREMGRKAEALLAAGRDGSGAGGGRRRPERELSAKQLAQLGPVLAEHTRAIGELQERVRAFTATTAPRAGK